MALPLPPTAPTPAYDVVVVTGLSNREFLEEYARAGRVGLSTGISLVDRAIAQAERHVDAQGAWGCWSHAFLFQGRRIDGHQWVIESDLQFHRKHIQLGVQENRIAKYCDEQLYTSLAVLDFGLTEGQVATLLSAALDGVAAHTGYSLRELAGTLVALHGTDRRGRANPLARPDSFYCSALVQHLFRAAGVDLVPGLEVKHTTPEDLARSPQPHRTWLLKRAVPVSRLGAALRRAARRVRVGTRRVRRRATGSAARPE